MRFFSRLDSDTSGVSALEFAICAPFFLMVMVGGTELCNLALMHMRVSKVAVTVADNAARVRTQIDEADINEIFEGAKRAGGGIDFQAHGRVVLSSLQDNSQPAPDSGQMINWQRCWGALPEAPAYGKENAGRRDATLASGMGREGKAITSAPGTAIMFVEVTYDYKPFFTSQLFGPQKIRYETAYNVRERVNQDISNTKQLTINNCDQTRLAEQGEGKS